MGTNFYLVSKSKKLMRKYFAVEKEYGITEEEYKIVDEPYLAYQVHLNKLSIGWRPLFQRHRAIRTFKELEDFCLENKNIVGIYDEYGKKYTWKQYYDRVYSHSKHLLNGFMKLILFSRIEVQHYILYHVANMRRRYICHLAIEYMPKKKSRQGSVFMCLKDHGIM